MKRYPLSLIPLLLSLLMLTIGSRSVAQTFFGVSSSPADNGIQNGPDATITPPAGMQSGDLVVVFGHYNNTVSTTLSISYAAGQVWNVGGTQFGNNQSYFIAWCRYNGAWTGSPIVSVPAGNTNAITATMYVYRPTNAYVTWAVDQAQANSNSNTNPHNITGVTNTGANTVSMAFWTNTLTNTWAGASGGTWTQAGISTQYRNTGTLLQGHSAAYRIGGSGATGNVQQNQNIATTTTRKAIMSWRQISNDLCTNAINLTSGTSCTNTSGNMFGATLTAPSINAPDCATGVTYDVWYRFVAQTSNPTISLSGVSFPNPNIQVLSNNCGGTFNSFFCGTTSVATSHLTPGTTYYIRVYSTGAAPGSLAAGAFNICITDPVSTAPLNDNCTGAVNITQFTNCSNTTPGNLAGATPSTPGLGGLCTGPLAYDSWYRFTANSTNATVTLSGLGANFTNPGIELLSGSCGSFISIACNTGTTLTVAGGLTVGSTYYIRVYSRSSPPPNGNARFNICLTGTLPQIRFGNTYVNITKQTTGGVVSPGDVLEIRMTLVHTAAGTVTQARFVDNVPTNTAMLTGPTDRIRIITNEGLPYKEYTLAAGDDAATYTASPPPGQFNIRVNLGLGGTNPGNPVDNTSTETASVTGTITNSNRPRGGGGVLFAIAYRVVVTGAVGNTITLNPAQFIYNLGGNETITGTPYQIRISQPLTLCEDNAGLNNATEFGGTFGSGNSLNRVAPPTTPINGFNYLNDLNEYNQIGDGRYSIVNNISPRSSTNRTANARNNCTTLPFVDPLTCRNRMFNGYWDIDGDHTGTNNSTGNIPPGPTTTGGYMLLVNSDFVTSEVYAQTLTNLCPNTYYEFSAWFRNVCPTCGVDSTGAQFAGTPTAPSAGYPGVLPNVSFSLDGVDYYSTGELLPNIGWQKRGFVFLTGPSQTTATLKMRNNAQGGGGNDWAMDDISIATCLPGLTMRPSTTPQYCLNGSIDLSVAVSTFFNNYTVYQWERSTDGGATWGPAPEMPGVQNYTYTYVAPNSLDTVTIPTFIGTASMNGYRYRIRTATSVANLSDDNCSLYNSSDIVLSILSSCDVLSAQKINLNATYTATGTILTWFIEAEGQANIYEIEKSTDGHHFSKIGYIYATGLKEYSFTDPTTVSGKTYYRIKMISSSDDYKYSNVVSVIPGQGQTIQIISLSNPFDKAVTVKIQSHVRTEVNVQLLDMHGRILSSSKQRIGLGVSTFDIPTSQALANGTYVIRITNNDNVTINRLILKQ